ncbi:MAG: hypothetical protein ABIP03_09275 [Aquihabitans sp.]
MHPIERLRYVARATGAPEDELVREAAASLAAFADDPVSLVTACRRLLDRHLTNGPIWWLCARTLAAGDPGDEAWRCLDSLALDRTVSEFGHALPEGARVGVVGWPGRLLPGFAPRGDLEVQVVDVEGDGPGFVRALERSDVAAIDAPAASLGRVAAGVDLVVIEALAVGSDSLLASPGSWALAAVASTSGVPVWAVAGVGRVVCRGAWIALNERLGVANPSPWEVTVDRVPVGLVDRLVGPGGVEMVADGLRRCDSPDVAELRR